MITRRRLESMAQNGAQLEICGNPTNYAIELRIYKEFERCCEIAGLIPEENIYIEDSAEIRRGKEIILGQAILSHGDIPYIKVNFNLLRKHLFFLEEIVAHEVAHVWDFLDNPQEARRYKGHGPAWGYKIGQLGYPARTHISFKKAA